MRISQREARRLKKRVKALEYEFECQRRAWSQSYFGATEITHITYDDRNATVPTAIRTARKLNHAVVAVGDDSGTVRFVALPHPKTELL